MIHIVILWVVIVIMAMKIITMDNKIKQLEKDKNDNRRRT